jgi:predicted TPR repeat methyltransferase
MAQAVAAHQAGQLDAAERGYRQAVALDDKQADAWHLLGVIAHQRGDRGQAEELIRHALGLNSANPAAQSNLGVVLMEMGQLEEAGQYLSAALSAQPGLVQAHVNLGNIHKLKGDYEQALTHYGNALSRNSQIAEAHHNMGVVLHRLNRLPQALASANQAVQLNSGHAEFHESLGNICKDLGDTSAARRHYQQALALNPELGNAKHFLSLLAGDTAERPPDSYVAALFDDYAERFDAHLPQVLGYQVPQVLAQRLQALGVFGYGPLDVLDLGCGTGLMGAAIVTHAKSLVGMDLSAKMLLKARQKNVYGRLALGEATQLMQREPASSFDLVLAADAFIYFGALEATIAQVKRLLRPGGYFGFSVETCTENPLGYELRASGRYAHGLCYLDSLAVANGFKIQEAVPEVIRSEQGRTIAGALCIWRNLPALPTRPFIASAISPRRWP